MIRVLLHSVSSILAQQVLAQKRRHSREFDKWIELLNDAHQDMQHGSSTWLSTLDQKIGVNIGSTTKLDNYNLHIMQKKNLELVYSASYIPIG